MCSKKIDKKPFIKGDVQIIVEKVRVEGRGVILLTGPSSCGKGEIAKALCKFLSIPAERHLSMGNILRMTINKARKDDAFVDILAKDYNISSKISIFDSDNNKPEIIKKAEDYKNELLIYFKNENSFISQLDWLEFCVNKGLLIPDEWTISIIDALFENTAELTANIFILDGYPRTVVAAEHLLTTLNRLSIPIIKVLHLSITKEQMKERAIGRGRGDDTEDSVERRYQFYVEKVQPCIDYLKYCLGVPMVTLIDAHQPVYDENGHIVLEQSIHQVILSVMESLGLPRYLLDI